MSLKVINKDPHGKTSSTLSNLSITCDGRPAFSPMDTPLSITDTDTIQVTSTELQIDKIPFREQQQVMQPRKGVNRADTELWKAVGECQ